MQNRVVFILACLGSTALFGQDVAKVAPAGVLKVEFEDAQIRVIRFKEPLGSKLAMHSHPAFASVDLTGGAGKFTMPDGKTVEQKWAAGDATFSEAVTHTGQITAGGLSESIMVELKTKPAGAALGGAGDMVTTNPKTTKVELDNEYVRITRVTIPPHGALAMHSHASPNVVVYITGGHVKTVSSEGKAEELTIEPGTVRVNRPSKHSNENLGDKTTVAVVVELKTAAK